MLNVSSNSFVGKSMKNACLKYVGPVNQIIAEKKTNGIVIICTLPRFYLLAEECIDGKGICKSKLAYGQGYEKLTADRIEYKISSPNKLAKIPTDFAGSGSIHVEIPNDASMSYKIIEISFSSPIGKCNTCL